MDMETEAEAGPRLARRVGTGLLGGLAFLRDLVFPPMCLGCGVLVGRHGALCTACWQKLHFIERPFCPVLGTPFSHDMGSAIVSAEAIANPPVFDRARAAVLYDDLAGSLVHALKYRDRTDLAPIMARWMLRAGDGFLETAQGLVPVPLHRRRLFSRRYNQSAELARALARLCGTPMLAHVLERRRNTRQQVGLGERQRHENVRGAFVVPEEAVPLVAGRHLVLIDDVYTTGATIAAASRALRKAGVREVTVLTFARVHKGLI